MDGWMVFDVNFQLCHCKSSLLLLLLLKVESTSLHCQLLPLQPCCQAGGGFPHNNSTQRSNKLLDFLLGFGLEQKSAKKTLPLNLLTSCRPFLVDRDSIIHFHFAGLKVSENLLTLSE
jgi:hypothetical protein